jgi:hypothetical protein
VACSNVYRLDALFFPQIQTPRFGVAALHIDNCSGVTDARQAPLPNARSNLRCAKCVSQ